MYRAIPRFFTYIFEQRLNSIRTHGFLPIYPSFLTSISSSSECYGDRMNKKKMKKAHS